MAKGCQVADCDRGGTVVCGRCRQPFCSTHTRPAWDASDVVLCVACYAAAARAGRPQPPTPARPERNRTTPG
jgi:hypothetical protein